MQPRDFFVTYQELSQRTLPEEHDVRNYAMGLAGEAGEVVELVKKHAYHGHPLDAERVAEELGDVLFYVAAMATACGLSLEQVADKNVEKLRQRYPNGFEHQKSRCRYIGR